MHKWHVSALNKDFRKVFSVKIIPKRHLCPLKLYKPICHWNIKAQILHLCICQPTDRTSCCHKGCFIFLIFFIFSLFHSGLLDEKWTPCGRCSVLEFLPYECYTCSWSGSHCNVLLSSCVLLWLSLSVDLNTALWRSDSAVFGWAARVNHCDNAPWLKAHSAPSHMPVQTRLSLPGSLPRELTQIRHNPGKLFTRRTAACCFCARLSVVGYRKSELINEV